MMLALEMEGKKKRKLKTSTLVPESTTQNAATCVETTGAVKPALNDHLFLSDHLLLATDFSCTESLPFKMHCARRPPA